MKKVRALTVDHLDLAGREVHVEQLALAGRRGEQIVAVAAVRREECHVADAHVRVLVVQLLDLACAGDMYVQLTHVFSSSWSEPLHETNWGPNTDSKIPCAQEYYNEIHRSLTGFVWEQPRMICTWL